MGDIPYIIPQKKMSQTVSEDEIAQSSCLKGNLKANIRNI